MHSKFCKFVPSLLICLGIVSAMPAQEVPQSVAVQSSVRCASNWRGKFSKLREVYDRGLGSKRTDYQLSVCENPSACSQVG
jgi:hypothetical protein